MASVIKKRFESLVRALGLETSSPEMVFQDEAYPVVLIHEHCEGDLLTAQSQLAGAGGPVQIAYVLAPRAGAYQLTMYWDSYVAAAADEAASFRIQTDVGGVSQKTIWYFYFGRQTVERGIHTIAKIHLDEGMLISAQLETALIATNYLTMGIALQPI